MSSDYVFKLSHLLSVSALHLVLSRVLYDEHTVRSYMHINQFINYIYFILELLLKVKPIIIWQLPLYFILITNAHNAIVYVMPYAQRPMYQFSV